MPVKIGSGGTPPSSNSETPENQDQTSMSFIKTGGAAKSLHQQEEAKAQAAREEAGKLWRFFISEPDFGKDFPITFLDGQLGDDGALEAPMWMEHGLTLGGSFKTFPCTAEHEPCPLCALDSSKSPSLVAGFTVIDHHPYKIKKGPNAGNIVKDRRKLFVAKRGTFAILQKLASKQGGLAGCTFEASRNGAKEPSVGSMFQFIERRKLSDLHALYGDEAVPADFPEEIVYRTAAELHELGVKGAASKVGGVGNSKDLDSELGFGNG